MRKIIIILISVLLLSACTSKVANGDLETMINSIEEMPIEADAKIHIGVFDDNFGQVITNYLNEQYPEAYTYSVIDESLKLDISEYDIVQTLIEYTPLMSENLNPIDEKLNVILENDYIEKYTKDVNQVENYFMPFDSKGLLFAYNKTMLESFGIDLSDSNDDKLPEAIDSFEKISELANKWEADQVTYRDDLLSSVFSFPFNEQLAMLSFIQNSNYSIVSGSKGEELNIGEDLYNALSTYQSLGETSWQFNGLENSDMLWNYEEVLELQSAPFLLVGNWMYYEDYQASQAYELVFTKLPSLNGADLSTLSSVSGFVLNKDSLYPNAQNLFLKAIKDQKGIEFTIDSGIIPIIDPAYIKDLEKIISSNIEEMIVAYTHSEYISLQAFEKDPSIIAFKIFYEVDFRDVWKELFLGEIEVDEAYSRMLDKINEWISNNNLELEGIEYELEEDNSEGND